MGSIQKVSNLISQKTGIALCINDDVAVEVNVVGGTITSSPGLTPTATTAACKAEDAELKATPNFVPIFVENFFSNSLIFLPPKKFSPGLAMKVEIFPLSKTSKTCFFSSGPIIGCLGKGVERVFVPPFIARFFIYFKNLTTVYNFVLFMNTKFFV